jgi:NADH-quinone oxidoreductase subunit B
MGVEEKLPSGILLTTVEKVAGYARKSSVWPATFGLACCAIELMQTGGPRHDLARFGMERASNTPRQADLMIVAGRVSQKMAPVLRQIYDQMADPKWVISMGVCASSGGMFNNYAIVQGVDHVVPVDIYLPGCPPRPEMLLDAIVKLHDKIMNMKLGVNREREVTELEEARLRRLPLATDLAGSRSRTTPDSGPTLLAPPALPSAAVRSRNLGMTSPPVHHEARATQAQAAQAQAAEVRATEAGGTGE